MRQSFAVLLSIILSLLLSPGMSAQRRDTLSFHLSFPQGVSSLEREMDGNGVIMDELLSALNILNENPQYHIHSVNISTAASPEGTKPYNDRLSKARARTILNYLMDGTTLSPSQIKVVSRGENWEGLTKIIRDCREPWKNEALYILSESGVLRPHSSSVSSRCKQQLQEIEHGRAWEWMEHNAFVDLRSASGSVLIIGSTTSDGPTHRDTLVIRHEDVIVHRDTVYSEILSRPLKTRKNAGFKKEQYFHTPVMALRSNLILPLMNIGVEVPLSNRFSLGADWYYPWAMRRWTNSVLPPQMYCAQMLSWSIEGRWWLGSVHSKDASKKYRLRGHSIALLGIGGYYDAEYEGSGQQGEFYGLGADYMYSLPLGKGGVHMELSLGVGCLWNPYRNYKVRTEGGYLTADGNQSLSRLMPAPVRIGISLSIPINAGKEAER